MLITHTYKENKYLLISNFRSLGNEAKRPLTNIIYRVEFRIFVIMEFIFRLVHLSFVEI